jgi:tight adherence protein B
MLLPVVTVFFVFGSVFFLSLALLPLVKERYAASQAQKAARASEVLDDMFLWISHNKLVLAYILSPLICAGLLFLFTRLAFTLLIGLVVGFLIPTMILRILEKRRKKLFHYQLMDALQNISQSLRAGLSFLQSLEVMVEEMPSPISQEFALILKENKMGNALETSFDRLNQKMDLEDLNMMTTAFLVARETGGNLAEVFTHLSDTVRQKHKINDQIKTLTTQARWQGWILSFLPFVFASIILKFNPDYFQVLIDDKMGRLLLVWCVISWLIGSTIMTRISKIDI